MAWSTSPYLSVASQSAWMVKRPSTCALERCCLSQGHCWGLQLQQSGFPFKGHGLHPKMCPDSEQTPWIHISTVYGAGHQGHSWGITGSDTHTFGGREVYSECKIIQKKKKVLIKNKQKIPQTHRTKKICTHFSIKTYLTTPKTETVRRYLYFKTSLVTFLTITWLPDSHLWISL